MNTDALRRLWQEAFADDDKFLDGFFSTGYCPVRCMSVRYGQKLAGALYWFDGSAMGRDYAYIYAVATAKKFRGQGVCTYLMEQAHGELERQGYAGACLVPGSESLFRFYEKLGYRTFGTVREFAVQAESPIPVRRIDAGEYAQLRRKLLPSGGLLQEGPCLDFLGTWCDFYAGEDWLLCAARDGHTLRVQEYLGDPGCAPGITAALDAKTGLFRTPGRGKNFAMYHPLNSQTPPTYLGLALD